MKTIKLLSLVCFLQISLLTSASVYFAPVKRQADLQSTDSFQIVIGHTYKSSSYSAYMYALTSANSTADGQTSCPAVTNWGGKTYWKNGACKWGRDTLMIPNLSEAKNYQRVWKISGEESQIVGYHGPLGAQNSTGIYTYRSSDSATYASYLESYIGTYRFIVDSATFTLSNNYTGHISIVRTDSNNLSYPYMNASSTGSTSTTCSYHFRHQSSASYYRVYRRVYHPAFQYKEIDGNDVSDITQLIIIPNSDIFTFDEWTMPKPQIANEYYKDYLEILDWRDANADPIGIGGETMTYAGYYGEDEVFTLYYRMKQPIAITGYVDYVMGELDKYATIPQTHVALINDSTILPNMTLRDARYQVVLNGWQDASGNIIGVPGDTVRLSPYDQIYPAYTITPYNFTFDSREYSVPEFTTAQASYTLTLPMTTWNVPYYEDKYSIMGWFDVATNQYVGVPGETVMVYGDMDLYMQYAGSPTSWFMRITSNDSLKTNSGSMNLILLNNYGGTYYAATSASSPMIGNVTGNIVLPQSYYWLTNGTDSYGTNSWNSVADQHLFSIDLTKPTEQTNTYNNNRFVWSLTSDSSTNVLGYNGYWGSYQDDFNSSSSYIYTYSNGISTAIDTKIKKFNIAVNPDSAIIDWVGATDDLYRYFCGYSSSYFAPTYKNDYYTNWRVFRQAYEMTYDVDDEILRYGTCITSQYVLDTVSLPAIEYTHSEFASYITIKGWYDENGKMVGMPGDVIVVTRNTNLHLDYAFHDFYKVTFDAKEHGTCELADTTALLPFQLPDVVIENGYYFKGWVSQTTDEVVGQAGSIYPAGAYMLTADDNLYAVYEKSYDILEWGTNSLTVEFMHPCKTAETQTANGTKMINQLVDCQTDSCIYTLQVTPGDLAMDEGQDLTIIFKDANGYVVSQAVTHVPAIISGTEDLMTNHEPAICKNIDLVILDGGVAVASNVPFTFQNIRIQGGGKLVVPTGTTINTNWLYMRSGTIAAPTYKFCYPQMVVNGTLNNISGKIKYECVLNEQQFYNLTLPYDVPIADITYLNGAVLSLNPSGSASNALWVAYYDGATRATGASGWKDFTGTTLKAGIGYTVAATPETIRPTGGRAKQRKYSVVRFPMTIDLTGGETKNDRSISVTSYPSQTGKDNDAGWNLVGNPYLADYGGAVTGLTNSNGIGLLVDDGLGGYVWSGKVRYVVLPNDQGTSYAPLVASASKLPAFKNFFVQIGSGDALGFKFTSRAQNAPARMLYAGNNTEEEEDNELMVGIKITRKGETETVGVLIGENHTDDYEINADLQKWSNPSGYNFYALGKGEQLSFIAVNEASAQNIELGYSVPDFGTITITADEAYDMSQVQSFMLTDMVARKTVDLLKDKYTYSFGSKSKSDNRFVLSVVRKAPSVVTDLDKVPATKQPTKVFYNNHLYILSGSQVFDACGTLLK